MGFHLGNEILKDENLVDMGRVPYADDARPLRACA